VTSTDEIIRMLIGTGIGAALALALVTGASTFLKATPLAS